MINLFVFLNPLTWSITTQATLIRTLSYMRVISQRYASLRNLNIYSLNIFSLMSSLDELRLLTETKSYIGINETKIDQLIDDSDISIHMM